MTTTTALLTLEEYLLYDDDTENRYELVDGKLIVMPPESDRNNLIALYLPVEVVSPGKTNRDRDYRYKRSEYAARGILEYWIVDPELSKVTLLSLIDGLYEEAIFEGDRPISSAIIQQLSLTAEQIFSFDQRS